jgi:arylsulfatase A-like enzyme
MVNYLQTGGLDRFFHPATFEKTKHAGSVDDRDTVEQAIAWIERGKEPFFVALNLQNSHLPYPVPSDFRRRFAHGEPKFSINFGMWPRSQADFVKDLYADSLAYVDVQIARLIGHLRERGVWDRTLIAVTGDHGQAFYEHGFSAHASALFDEVMRVPLVFRAPGLRPGIDPRPAQLVDIAPTVLDLLGVPIHPAFQGESLVVPEHDPQRAIYMVAQTPIAHQYAIVRGPHKLIYDEFNGAHQLFNVVNDPGEHADVAAREPELVRSLAERLFTWREAQIGYYADRERYTREYPPVLAD